MRRVCERLRADLRSDFHVVGGAAACIVTAARGGPSSEWFAFGFELCSGSPRLHCDRRRADSRFVFKLVVVAIARIVKEARARPSFG